MQHRVTNRMVVRLVADDGSAGYSTFVFILALMAILGLGIAGMRMFTGASDLQAAAQAGARAAALEHTMADAQAAAQRVINGELASAGAACQSASITRFAADPPTFEPGGTITVELQCTVLFGDLPAMNGTKIVTASAVEPIDCLRGGGQTELTTCYYDG